MKLLLCRSCQDVQKLRTEPRWCACGKSGGRYLEDLLHAEYWGRHALLIGFANNTLADAVLSGLWKSGEFGPRFTAFIIPETATTVRKVRTPRTKEARRAIRTDPRDTPGK